MNNSARDHFVQVVVPACEAFFEARDKNRFGEKQLVRLGTAAAAALYHQREHLPAALRPSRQALESRCPEYGLLGDVANVAKHHTLTKGKPKLHQVEQVAERLILTRYSDARGAYNSAQAEVELSLDDGSELTLVSQVNIVLRMWAGKLASLGFGGFSVPQADLSDDHVPRKRAKPMPIEILRGEDRNLGFRLREFDYSVGHSKPVNLTGSKLRFTVYKPLKAAAIQIHVGQSSIDFSVPLTQKQSLAFMALETEQEQGRYLASLIKRSAPIQRQIQAAILKATGTQSPTVDGNS